jgi:hypothetical protein
MAVFSFFLFVVYGFFGAVLAIFRNEVVKDGKNLSLALSLSLSLSFFLFFSLSLSLSLFLSQSSINVYCCRSIQIAVFLTPTQIYHLLIIIHFIYFMK